jgi:hypothetical protein
VGNATELRRALRDLNSQNEDFRFRVYGACLTLSPFSWLSTSYLLRLQCEELWSYGGLQARAADFCVLNLGLKLQLALIAYRVDHERYPDNWDALVPDYLPHVPLDPYAGEPFQYEPHGLPGPLRGQTAADSNEPVPSNTPIFWSVGQQNGMLIKWPWRPRDSDDQPPKEKDQEHPTYEYGFTSNETLLNMLGELLFPLPK